jgi:hypothetical protein
VIGLATTKRFDEEHTGVCQICTNVEPGAIENAAIQK